MAIANLLVNIDTNVARFTNDMQKMSTAVEQTTGRINRAMDGMRTAFVAVGAIVAGGAIFKGIVDNAANAELQIRKVEQVIKSTGGVAGVTAKQVSELGNALQKQTGVSNDALNAASALMLTFTNINSKVFPDAIAVVNDMSKALGQDMKSSVIQVGKALNDPIKGITALQRVGVSFTEQQKDLVKSLVTSGQTFQAQQLILKELQTEFGGAAAAARDTFGGAVEALKNNIDDLQESIGLNATGGGLRYAVETLNIVVERTTETLEAFRTGTFEANKEIQMAMAFAEGLYKAFLMLADSIRIGTNVAIGFFIEFATRAKEGFDELMNFVGGILQIPGAFKNASGAAENFFKEFFGFFGKEMPTYLGNLKQGMEAAGQDYVGAFTKPFADGFASIQKDVDKRLALIRKAADSAKAHIGIGGDAGASGAVSKAAEKAAKKSADELKRQEEALDSIVKNFAQHTRQLEARANHDESTLGFREAILKINELTRVSEEKRLRAAETINEYLQRELKAEQKIKEEKEAQAELDKRNSDLKTADEILNAHREEIKALEDKIKGQDKLTRLKEEERKITEDLKHLTASDRQEKIDELRKLYAEQTRLNDTYKEQLEVVDRIVKSTDSYEQKLKRLEDAYGAGRINAEQMTDAISKLDNKQADAKKSASSWIDTIKSGFQDMIFSGNGFLDVLKNLGKELATMAAKQFVLDPIFNGLKRLLGIGGGSPTAGGGGGGIGGIFQNIGNALNIFKGFSNAWQSVGINPFQQFGLAGSSLLNSLGIGNLLNGFSAQNLLSGASGLFSKIMGRASGGYVGPNTWFQAGEQGRELIYSGAGGATVMSNAHSNLMQATGNNIYGISNYGNMDMRLITGAYNGTQWYQASGANVQHKPEVQALMAKQARWNALPPSLKLAYSGNPDYWVSNEEKIRAMAASRTMTWQEEQDMKMLMYRQNRARADALIANSAPGSLNANLGYDILANNTYSQLSLLNPHSRVALPEGNQLGRILLTAAHRGVMPNSGLMNFANQADAFADFWNPSGTWNMWFTGSGSREGMGGVGSGAYFRGNSSYVMTGDATDSWYQGSYAGNSAPIASRLHGPALPPGWKVGPDGRSVPGRVVPGGYQGIGGPARGLLGYQPFGGGNPFADIIPGGIEGLIDSIARDIAQSRMGGPSGSASSYDPYTHSREQYGIYGPGNQGGARDNQLGGANYPFSNSPLYWTPQQMPGGMADPSNWTMSRSGGRIGSFPGAGVASGYGDVFSGPNAYALPAARTHYPSGVRNLYTGFLQGAMDSLFRRQHGGGIEPFNTYEVGEAGRELFVSGARGQIVSNQAAQKMGGGGNVYITNNTTGRVDQVQKQTMPNGDTVLLLRELSRALAPLQARTSR